MHVSWEAKYFVAACGKLLIDKCKLCIFFLHFLLISYKTFSYLAEEDFVTNTRFICFIGNILLSIVEV